MKWRRRITEIVKKEEKYFWKKVKGRLNFHMRYCSITYSPGCIVSNGTKTSVSGCTGVRAGEAVTELAGVITGDTVATRVDRLLSWFMGMRLVGLCRRKVGSEI